MASVMYDAAQTEDVTTQQSRERLAQLEYENKYLRELLSLSSSNVLIPNAENKKPSLSSHQQPVTPSYRDSSDSDDSRCSTPKAENTDSV